MAQRAMIQIRAVVLPGRSGWQLGVGPVDHFGAGPAEQERVAREAARAGVLVHEATAAQKVFLERLALSAGETFRFPFVSILERFLSATRGIDQETSDAVLTSLWEAASSEAD